MFSLRFAPRHALGVPLLAALSAIFHVENAEAQTWPNRRSTPTLRELVAVDATGEPGWLFGSEDLLGDGLTSFGEPEAAIDVRSAYVARRADRLGLRVYVSADELSDELGAYAFIDTDRNDQSGGSGDAPEIAAALTMNPPRGGYELVVGMLQGNAGGNVWRWQEANERYEPIDDLEPLGLEIEAGTDLDPLEIGAARHGYLQATLDADALELPAACGIDFLFRSSDGSGNADADIGEGGPCRPSDDNQNSVADIAEVDARCSSDAECPARGRCVEGSCRAPQLVLGPGEVVRGGAFSCGLPMEGGPSRSAPWRGIGLMLGLCAAWRRARRSRRARVSIVLGLVSWAGPRNAAAQVDAERLDPAITHDGWVAAEGSAVRHPDDRWTLGAWLHYAHHPLVVRDERGELVQTFVGGRLGFDATIAASLGRRVAVGAALPLFVLQSGDVDPSSAGVGDLRVVPKWEVLSDADAGLGLALLAELRLPTHSGDFSGGHGLEVVPKVALDHRYPSGVRIGFNLGVVLRETARLANVQAGDELSYAAALGYRLGGAYGRTEIGVELDGGVGLGETDPEELPLELFGFVRHDISRDWQLIGGPSIGILEGYGVPSFRAFFGVRFAPTRHDRDADGHSDAEDACPEEAEDRDGVEDGDGCPEEDPDLDHDGVADVHDQCPDAKETINGVTDDDGCPDSGDPRVVYDEGSFNVLDAIRFERGSAQITSDSYSLLDQVAMTLKANPEIEHMRVEGHTDDTGPRALNMQLSEERARAVRRYLIQRGVNPGRLNVRSYGPDRPALEGTDPNARAKNRRVEFVLE